MEGTANHASLVTPAKSPRREGRTDGEGIGFVMGNIVLKIVIGLTVIVGGGQLAMAAPTETASSSADQAQGKKIFARYCVGCHGKEGTGDGYRLLGPEPADLTRPATKSKSNAALLHTIHEGKPNMPSWKVRLSEQESRAVLAYIRMLAK
jgi:mono/diheme cytochrome c family protein